MFRRHFFSVRGAFGLLTAKRAENNLASRTPARDNRLVRVPHKNLQERTINAASFVDRYGIYLIDWIYQAIDLDDKEHRIIYL